MSAGFAVYPVGFFMYQVPVIGGNDGHDIGITPCCTDIGITPCCTDIGITPCCTDIGITPCCTDIGITPCCTDIGITPCCTGVLKASVGMYVFSVVSIDRHGIGMA